MATFFVYAGLGAHFVFFNLYLQFLGFSPFEAGLVSLPTSVVMILLASRFGALADRFGPRPFLVGRAHRHGRRAPLLHSLRRHR